MTANDLSRSPRRSWGPFSGAQLTVIAVTGILALAIPAGASAAAGLQHVVISGGSGHNAAVDQHSRLQVGGSVRAGVSGSVTARVAAPNDLFQASRLNISSSAGCVPVITAPAQRGLVVTDLQINVYDVATVGSGNRIGVYRAPSCTGAYLADVNPGSVGTYPFHFSAGIAVPAGGSLYADAVGSPSAETYAYAYAVPAASVARTHLTTFGRAGENR